MTTDKRADEAIRMRELIFGQVIAQTVAAIVRLGVIDELAAGPRTGAELAAATGAPAPVLGRFLRACAGLGLLEEVEADTFALAPLGEWLLPGPRSLRHLAVALAAPGHWRSVAHLTDTISTGDPAPPWVLGTGLWDYYERHPAERVSFAAAMGSTSDSIADELLQVYDVAPFRRVVDVGGSEGVLLARILEQNPDASGVLFDRPEVVELARASLAEREVASRIELRGGDFFEAVPAGGDLYLLKHILHDWDDEHAAAILHTCHRAGRAGSTLLLVERVLGPDSGAVDLVADLLMHVMFAGKERSEREFEALLDGAGYRLERIVPMPMFSLLEARRM